MFIVRLIQIPAEVDKEKFWKPFPHFCPFQEMKPELSYLAHHANSIDKYREETCCVIGQSSLSVQKFPLWFPVILL